MRKGFTLIELLIVIALLGTLAVALLAAIDPFEQFRKGADTGVRNTTQEIFNAAIRYYALRNAWPVGWTDFSDTGVTVESVGPAVIIQPLIDAGELKDNFVQLAGDSLAKIYISKASSSRTESHLAVCFRPESKSFQQADANTKFVLPDYSTDQSYYGPDTDATDTPVCKVNGGGSDCYWCVY